MATIYDLKDYVAKVKERYGWGENDGDKILQECIDHFGYSETERLVQEAADIWL